jgi:hypothetical protein
MPTRRELFGHSNGHSDPLSDELEEWIQREHPLLMDHFINRVKKELIDDPEDENKVAMSYMAMGQVLLICGSQFLFDVATGTIFTFTEDDESLERGVVLHNIDQARKRAHDYVDNVFDQFSEEFKEN